jgi:hypothetical protein
MAYTVNNFNGTFLTTVADGTIDTTTDIRFVGKNYAGYGEIQNENFLHLMESFANTTPPPKAVIGQIWYDSTSTEKKLKFWDGTNWKIAGGARAQSSEPSGLTAGEFWWDTSTKQLKAWTGTEFVLIGPETSPDLGASAVTARVVKDEQDNAHTIVEIKSSGKTVVIVSEDDDFKLDASKNSIPGFNPPFTIKRGVTLASTNNSGISQNHIFWGTSSAALGIIANGEFIEGSSISNLLSGNLSQNVRFQNTGFLLGNSNELRVWNDQGSTGLLIQSQELQNAKITIRLGQNDLVSFQDQGLIPANNTKSLGSTSSRWNTVFSNNIVATTISGTLTGNSAGVHTGNVLAANGGIMIDANTNRIGNPDGSTVFRGTYLGAFGTLEQPGTFIGTADTANRLAGIIPSEQVPAEGTKVTIPVRDMNGDVYARNFVASGSVNRADQLKFGSVYVAASSTIPGGADKSSIAARDSAGDIYATLFRGTATAARYADLAEKYLADKEYEVGTVVSVGGDAEVTATQFGDRAIGVVSANPAFMMNSELEGGTYIALKGRVPVKVIGAVKKKDRLVATDNGCAIKATHHQHSDVFAIALEDSSDTGIKLIEAVIL